MRIEELAAIFKELAVLVIDQGTILDRIDYNMESAVDSAKEGVKQLEKAARASESAAMRAVPCAPVSDERGEALVEPHLAGHEEVLVGELVQLRSVRSDRIAHQDHLELDGDLAELIDAAVTYFTSEKLKEATSH